MNTTLLENPDQTVCGPRREVELSALVEKLLGEVAELRDEVATLRQQAGYWKGMFEHRRPEAYFAAESTLRGFAASARSATAWVNFHRVRFLTVQGVAVLAWTGRRCNSDDRRTHRSVRYDSEHPLDPTGREWSPESLWHAAGSWCLAGFGLPFGVPARRTTHVLDDGVVAAKAHDRPPACPPKSILTPPTPHPPAHSPRVVPNRHQNTRLAIETKNGVPRCGWRCWHRTGVRVDSDGRRTHRGTRDDPEHLLGASRPLAVAAPAVVAVFWLPTCCRLPLYWLGKRLDKTRREQAVVAKIESVGGWVEYHDIDGPPRITKHFRRVRAVYLNEPRVVAGDILHLDQMDDSDLQALDWLKVTDDTLVPLKDLMMLQRLGLSGAQITDMGLEYLNEMASLDMLWLENTQVTNEGVKTKASRSSSRHRRTARLSVSASLTAHVSRHGPIPKEKRPVTCCVAAFLPVKNSLQQFVTQPFQFVGSGWSRFLVLHDSDLGDFERPSLAE